VVSGPRGIRDRWRALSAALAAVSSSVEARRALLDPEAYALELEEHHAWASRFPEVFRDFMDLLVEEYARWVGTRATTVFVVVVEPWGESTDHFDLAARVLLHPRLAFVIGGGA